MLRSTQISYSLAYCSFVMALNPEGCRAARIRKNGVATMSRAGNSSSHSIVTNSRYRIQNRSSPAIMVATSRIILISFVERHGSPSRHLWRVVVQPLVGLLSIFSFKIFKSNPSIETVVTMNNPLSLIIFLQFFKKPQGLKRCSKSSNEVITSQFFKEQSSTILFVSDQAIEVSLWIYLFGWILIVIGFAKIGFSKPLNALPK